MNSWAVAFVLWVTLILIVLLVPNVDDDEEESQPFQLEDFRYGDDASVSRESEEE